MTYLGETPVPVEPAQCAWCGRTFRRAGTGRPRRYCRRSCRQRAFEARRRHAELGLGEHELVVTREQLERTHDAVYALACAVDDVERDLGDAPTEIEVREALAWLLGAAHDVVEAG